jgi:prepilin-type N-terminal cleavage/methylation domain-containing protein
MKMKKLKKGEGGFTLIELLIAIALTAIITSTATMAIFQTFTGSTRSANHMVAVRQVQEAGYWVSLYAYMAADMEITGDSGFPLILSWVDFEPPPGESEVEEHKVVFSLNSSGLRGYYYVDSGSGYVLDEEKTGQIPAFEVIDTDGTNLKLGGGSAFSLPDEYDAFQIIGDATPDNGKITVREGSISVTTTGDATCNQIATDPYDIYEWETTAVGDIITVTATSADTEGSWTSETQAVSAAITADGGGQSATLSTGRVLIFTVTATVGTGQQETGESRVYEIVPKPVS